VEPFSPDNPIDAAGVRILGSLIEKEATTPDNYPLTLNALTAACNQTSNRSPVMELDEHTVRQSLEDLAVRKLVRAVQRSDSRVKRYRQTFAETLSLHSSETAIMCVLMLRGVQTPGEIKTRAGRIFEFNDLAQVELALQSLVTLSRPLVVQLPRQPGQKEARYAHLLSGEPDPEVLESQATQRSPGRLEALEQEVRELRTELGELRDRFDAFSREFQ
jgi:uncharacterized protein